MSIRVKNKATNEQIEALIRKYSTNESVLRILYTGKVNTLIMLEHGLQKGLTLGKLAGGSACFVSFYYDTNLKAYHTVAYLDFTSYNLKETFPLCKVYTFQEIYDMYRDYKVLDGRKEDIGNDIDSIIFPKYSIIDCQLMPTLSAYKRIFGKFVAEDAHRFIRGEGLIPRPSGAVIKVLNPRPIPLENNIPRCSAAGLLIIFINYHAKEVFHGSGGKGHILFSSGNEVSENNNNRQGVS
jgi:hypothetical protein